MEVKLKVLVGKNAGSELLVAGPLFRIGRADECHLRPRSEGVSRFHCEIEIAESGVVVRDLKSRNGTFVNNEPIEGDRKLAPGDQLRVGPLVFEVLIKHTLGVGKKPRVGSISEAAARTAQASNSPSVDPEMDIDTWLGDDDTADGSDGPKMSQTTGFFVPNAADDAEGSDDKAAPDGSTPPKFEVPKTKATDTRQAAADVLNKYFKRR